MSKKLTVLVILLLGISLNTRAQQPNFNSFWEGSSGQFPDETCSPWEHINSHGYIFPVFIGDSLRFYTNYWYEVMYYRHNDSDITFPDMTIIEARVRVEGGVTYNPLEYYASIEFTVMPDIGNILEIGFDTIFILAGPGLKGQQALVDTDDEFHTYRIEIINKSGFNIYYDDSLVITGSTFADANWWDEPSIGWGKITDQCDGAARWLYFKHNAYVLETGTDTDGDGIIDVCDNCISISNADQADADGDGFGNACDNCPNFSNPSQTDTDGDGIGNACDVGGDVSIMINNGIDEVYIGETNTIEIWIRNEQDLSLVSMGFELSIGRDYSVDETYGSLPPFNEEGDAYGAFIDLFRVANTSINGDGLDSVHFGGITIGFNPLPAHLAHSLCYTLQFDILPDQTELQDGFCIDNIVYESTAFWQFDNGTFSFAPTYQGIPNITIEDPTAPPVCFDIVIRQFTCGDANGDELINIFDATFLITYLYMGGPAPDPLESADVNNDGNVNIFDVTYVISYLYMEGPEPSCP